MIEVSVGRENSYWGAAAVAEKPVHLEYGVHPHVDDDAFMAAGGSH